MLIYWHYKSGQTVTDVNRLPFVANHTTRNMKKVLFIIPSLDIGGTENICKILFQEFLFKKKYDVDLFVLNIGDMKISLFIPFIK